MRTLLVIDDDESILYAFRQSFDAPDATVATASSGQDGVALVKQTQPDAVILDVGLPDMSGLEAFRRIRQADAKVPVIIITGHGTMDTAIEAMKLGALDYLVKPLELDELSVLVERAFAISRLMRVPAVVAGEAEAAADSSDVLVGQCKAMQQVYKAIGRVAPQDVTVLLLGESGTGKELVARAIYHHSGRSDGPFLAINCAAIPETLLESEFFGHEKGAFTGADRKRIGKFEQSSGGTLFLDEIGDMPALTQTKILRVLQEQRFERLGGSETVQTNVRLIAATNQDLEQMVAAGAFRSDLYYRLRVFTIRLPPLRERLDDLPLLVDYFVRRFSRDLKRDVQTVAPETLELLGRYPWPGNVRELQSVLKQALLHASGPLLLPDFLPPVIGRDDRAPPADSSPGRDGAPEASAETSLPSAERFVRDRLAAGAGDLHEAWMTLMERELIVHVLKQAGGNQVQAARLLGIDRGSLRSKIRSLGIAVERTIR